MAVKMQEDYRIGYYVGTFGLVCSACDDFLQSLNDDIDYKRVSDLHGMVVIATNKSCIQNCVTAFLMLQGWFEDKRISDLEYEIEESDRRQAARENAEFWDEYYFFNPNDV